jgi:uncharacterized phiE125 gp8 family phage protein
MLYSLTRLQAPDVEPVTLDQVKQHLRIAPEFADDDALLIAYISAAREYVESYTRRCFLTSQWQLSLDHFPQSFQMPSTVNPSMRRDWPYYSGLWNQCTIALPKPYCVSVDSITYLDGNGAQQTLDPSAYVVDVDSAPARIVPAPGLFWPIVTAYRPGSVKVKFTAGRWSDADSVPKDIQVAILLIITQWYTNPSAAGATQNEMPFAVSALLGKYVFTCLDLESVV